MRSPSWHAVTMRFPGWKINEPFAVNTDQVRTIRSELSPVHGTGMACKDLHSLPRRKLPQPDRTIVGSSQKYISLRVPFQNLYIKQISNPSFIQS